jgi:hypothetical protein
LIFEGSEFTFELPPQVAWARRVLIKPCAGYPLPYPVTTSRETLEAVISGIRQVSDADVVLLEGSPYGKSMRSLYRALGYDFPRVVALGVEDCALVEVENPLAHPFALATFWLPNVLLYCDYLISVSPFKVCGNQGCFSIKNLLSLLPLSKYQGEAEHGWGALYSLGIQKVVADLYFTLPFDLGIIDARKKFFSDGSLTQGRVEDYNKIFVGELYEVDSKASQMMGLETEYLRLIGLAKR